MNACALCRQGVALVLALLVGVSIAPRVASAQSDTGRIEGTVVDTTGGTLPGATVTLTNLATGIETFVITDEAGRYVATPLRAGRYKVRVELAGFTPAETPEVTLTVNQVASFDYTLTTGGLSETVQVVAQQPLLEKVTSSIGTVINEQQVKELPLNGRNFTQLATLTPGVNRGVQGGQASGEGGNTETFRYGDTGGAALSVNGVREQFNNYLLDGVDNNESLVNSVAIFPPVEGLQEFRVITNGAQAEFGRAGGAVINVITKGGSNSINGSVYEFHRNEALDAKPRFSSVKQDFERNQFGFSLGGPIARNRTFFFGEYQGLRESLPTEVGRRVTVPTQRMRSGDFSELLNASFTGVNAPIFVFDPQTGQPFPGNVIPTNRLNPVAVNYLNFFPLPDLTDRAQGNYNSRRLRDSNFNTGTVRIDHVFNASQNLFGRGSFGSEERFDPGFIPGAQAGFGSGTANNDTFGLALGYNNVLKSDWILETRFGANDQEYGFLPVGFGNDVNAQLGIPGPGGITSANGISLIGGGDGRYIEYLGDFGQYIVPQRTYQFSGSITNVRGNHTFKAGGTFIRRSVAAERQNFGKGFYFFSDCIATPAEIAGGRCGGSLGTVNNTGYEVANMLIGVTNFTQTGFPDFPRRETLSWENSVYLQDDWRATSRLTLNLGLRYDIFTPYTEVNDQMANFNLNTDRLEFAGINGVSRSTRNTDYNNFGPRAGAAYQVNDKTVLRAAYGLFYTMERGGIDNQLTENPPFNISQFRSADNGGAIRLSDPIILPPRPDLASYQRDPADRVISYAADQPTSSVQQFNVGVQRELNANTALLVAYVGTRGDNLTTVFQDPQGRNATILANFGQSSYNGLQFQLRQTARAGLSYLASYTLGKATTDSPGTAPGPQGSIQGSAQGLEPGPADYDRRHQFSLAATYELPWLRDQQGVRAAVLGGWQGNVILTFQSGAPFNVFANGIRAQVSGAWQGPETVDQWFNTQAFSVADTLGQSHPRNLLRGPGISTTDLSFFKSFKTVSDHRLELRFEVFNVFDKDQFAFPNNQFGSADFGRILQTRLNSQRQGQIAVRYVF